MQQSTCFLISDNPTDIETLKSHLQNKNLANVLGQATELTSIISLIDKLEPNLLFLAIDSQNLSVFKTLERLKKQPTIVFIVPVNAPIIGTFTANNMQYINSPVSAVQLNALFVKLNQTHLQIAKKMEGLLGKLKLIN